MRVGKQSSLAHLSLLRSTQATTDWLAGWLVGVAPRCPLSLLLAAVVLAVAAQVAAIGLDALVAELVDVAFDDQAHRGVRLGVGRRGGCGAHVESGMILDGLIDSLRGPVSERG